MRQICETTHFEEPITDLAFGTVGSYILLKPLAIKTMLLIKSVCKVLDHTVSSQNSIGIKTTSLLRSFPRWL